MNNIKGETKIEMENTKQHANESITQQSKNEEEQNQVEKEAGINELDELNQLEEDLVAIALYQSVANTAW